MNHIVNILGVQAAPILCLQVAAPAQLAKALAVPGQSAVHSFHITLARLDDLGLVVPANLSLPAPPSAVGLKDEVRMVATGEKRACYVEIDDAGQQLLREYVARCGELLGASLGQNSRVFHVTLSNAGGGEVRASVGCVWDYPSQLI